jgi:hypothetical protein
VTDATVDLLPTIVLVGGQLILDDGSQVDSRQPMADAATGRAVRLALVSSAQWWDTVASIVIPSLDDAKGGSAYTSQRTLVSVGRNGDLRRVQFPRFPRSGGGKEDYIYNPRTWGAWTQRELDRAPPSNRRRIYIDTNGSFVHNLRCSLRATGTLQKWNRTEIVVLPDMEEMRKRIFDSHEPTDDEERLRHRMMARADPYRHLRMSVVRADCKVSGVVRAGQWQDPSGLEAARLLLLERFDLKLGLWDLADNPVLRATVLAPSPTQPIPVASAEAPRSARERAERQALGGGRELQRKLASVGWMGVHHPSCNRACGRASFVSRSGIKHSDQPDHPYLRLIVSEHNVRVVVWHWGYTTFDINAFVDRRREAFDAISALPARKRLRDSAADSMAKYRKPGEVIYEKGRLMDDARYVPLWVVEKGWADNDTDWSSIAREVAARTQPWVGLLSDAIAECLGHRSS